MKDAKDKRGRKRKMGVGGDDSEMSLGVRNRMKKRNQKY